MICKPRFSHVFSGIRLRKPMMSWHHWGRNDFFKETGLLEGGTTRGSQPQKLKSLMWPSRSDPSLTALPVCLEMTIYISDISWLSKKKPWPNTEKHLCKSKTISSSNFPPIFFWKAAINLVGGADFDVSPGRNGAKATASRGRVLRFSPWDDWGWLAHVNIPNTVLKKYT